MEFKNLSTKQLITYISDDHLKTSHGEIEVFRATLKWFEANQSTAGAVYSSSDLADLMKFIRFALIPSDLLLDEVLKNILISENPQVMEMVTEALRFHNKLFSQPLQEGNQYQPRGEQMLDVILSTVRNTGLSLRVNETEMFMIRGTGSRPFHTYYSEHALPMKFIPGSLSVVTAE